MALVVIAQMDNNLIPPIKIDHAEELQPFVLVIEKYNPEIDLVVKYVTHTVELKTETQFVVQTCVERMK